MLKTLSIATHTGVSSPRDGSIPNMSAPSRGLKETAAVRAVRVASASDGPCWAHPEFQDAATRIRSFSRTPANGGPPDNGQAEGLARLGFFRAENGSIQCYACGRSLSEVPADLYTIEHSSCRHHRHLMKSLQERLASFKTWTHRAMRKEPLARSGFFLRPEDGATQCAYCGVIVSEWTGTEDVLYTHTKLRVNCPFILNLPPYALQDSPDYENERNLLSAGGQDESERSAGVLVRHTGPRYSNMVSPDRRLATFAEWTAPIDKERLVECGLFALKMGDFTKCFHCGGGLCSWQPNDDPWTEHARWYPDCEYVKLVKGDDFIKIALAKHGQLLKDLRAKAKQPEDELHDALERELASILASDEMRFYESKGVDRQVLRVALRNFMVAEGRGFGSPEELSEVLNSTLQLPPTPDPASPSAQPASATDVPERLTCVICGVNSRESAFLPCGHLVACGACAASVSSCPVCRSKIDNVLRVYLT